MDAGRGDDDDDRNGASIGALLLTGHREMLEAAATAATAGGTKAAGGARASAPAPSAAGDGASSSSSPSSSSTTGSGLDDFEVEDRLGKGAYGVVHRARRRRDGKLYVIKTISLSELGDAERAEAVNEVSILASITSPFIVRYYDSFVAPAAHPGHGGAGAGSGQGHGMGEENLHIVMEYCNRGDLQRILHKLRRENCRSVAEDKIWQIFVQVALGLHHLHSRQILHRDMKAANVFIHKDEQTGRQSVKIGDLGVAKLLSHTTAFATTLVGTPYYLSPELCQNKPYNERSDVWSLGVLLYQCCTLRLPFEANNPYLLMTKIIKGKYEPVSPKYLSAPLCDLVKALLTSDSDARPSLRQVLAWPFIQEKILAMSLDLPPDIPLAAPVPTNPSPSPSPSPTDAAVAPPPPRPSMGKAEEEERQQQQQRQRLPSLASSPSVLGDAKRQQQAPQQHHHHHRRAGSGGRASMPAALSLREPEERNADEPPRLSPTAAGTGAGAGRPPIPSALPPPPPALSITAGSSSHNSSTTPRFPTPSGGGAIKSPTATTEHSSSSPHRRASLPGLPPSAAVSSSSSLSPSHHHGHHYSHNHHSKSPSSSSTYEGFAGEREHAGIVDPTALFFESGGGARPMSFGAGGHGHGHGHGRQRSGVGAAASASVSSPSAVAADEARSGRRSFSGRYLLPPLEQQQAQLQALQQQLLQQGSTTGTSSATAAASSSSGGRCSPSFIGSPTPLDDRRCGTNGNGSSSPTTLPDPCAFAPPSSSPPTGDSYSYLANRPLSASFRRPFSIGTSLVAEMGAMGLSGGGGCALAASGSSSSGRLNVKGLGGLGEVGRASLEEKCREMEALIQRTRAQCLEYMTEGAFAAVYAFLKTYVTAEDHALGDAQLSELERLITSSSSSSPASNKDPDTTTAAAAEAPGKGKASAHVAALFHVQKLLAQEERLRELKATLLLTSSACSPTGQAAALAAAAASPTSSSSLLLGGGGVRSPTAGAGLLSPVLGAGAGGGLGRRF